MPWCNVTDVWFSGNSTDAIIRKSTGQEIGIGKTNTNVMVEGCSSGALVTARTYLGGGKNDWFLPSLGELKEIHSYVNGEGTRYITGETLRKGFDDGSYWTSSEQSERGAISYYWWGTTPSGTYKYVAYRVRPIRAFS